MKIENLDRANTLRKELEATEEGLEQIEMAIKQISSGNSGISIAKHNYYAGWTVPWMLNKGNYDKDFYLHIANATKNALHDRKARQLKEIESL